ncbi:MAG: hypothetical protein M3063_14670 [Actinomycetota bacterium]|nr:hypothetical protein [Actinomycetota bacterium]
MPFAAALSSYPVTAHATGEVIGQVIDQLGTHPDLAVLAVSSGHLGALEDAAAAVRSLLAPTVLLGWVAAQVTTGAVLPSPPQTARVDALGLWAAHTGPVVPVRLAGGGASGWTEAACGSFEPQGLVVAGAAGTAGERSFPDGCFPSGLAIAGAISEVPGAPVVLDGATYTSGAVGVLVGPGVDLTVIVEQGRRPIGSPSTVTRAEGSLVVDLDGRPAMAVLVDIARDQVPACDIALINRSLHLQVTTTPGAAPTLHAVRGRDASTSALVADPQLQVGDVVQFCVRDPERAAQRARQVVDGAEAGALVWQTRRSAARLDEDRRVGSKARSGSEPHPAPALLASGAASLLGGSSPPGEADTISIGLFRERQVTPG